MGEQYDGSGAGRKTERSKVTERLRQAVAAVIEGSWALPTIDTKLNIRSMLAPLGPVFIFGPNNFPFAYNGVAGGDLRRLLRPAIRSLPRGIRVIR